MSSATALELINRVMLFRRQPPISVYDPTDPEHVVTLNALNMAKEDLLGSRRYEFDLRHDGQLITKASTNSRSVAATLTVTAGQSSGQLDLISLTASQEVLGNHVTRVIPSGNSTYSGTAFRVQTALCVANEAAVGFSFAVPDAMAAVSANVIWAEYMLPDTVREVVRASYDQSELRLEQLSPITSFDEMIPDLSYESGSPRTVSVGGFDTQTYSVSGSVPDPKLRAVVWPVPDNEYVISYSYYYKHADFVDGASVITGVPDGVLNDVVWKAVSIMKMAWDGDYTAAHFSDMAELQATAKLVSYGGARTRRHTVKSWNSGQSVVELGFPNKLIGDV